MEEAESPIAPEEKPQRDSLGRLLPGCAPQNPTGENGLTGWAHVQARQDYFLDKMTAADIKRIVMDDSNMAKYTGRDWQILIHIAGTISGKEKGKERERMYDRRYGKPVQTIVTTTRKSFTEEDYASMTPEQAQAAYEQSIKS